MDEFWQGFTLGVVSTILFSITMLGVAIACASEGTDSNH